MKWIMGERCGRARTSIRVWTYLLVALCLSFRCAPAAEVTDIPETSAIAQFQGQIVQHISFEGIAADRIAALGPALPQKAGAPLQRDQVAASLRQLFGTGLFNNLEAAVEQQPEGLTLVFRGVPRIFIGTVAVNGAKGATMNTQLDRASRLNAGTRFTNAKMTNALTAMRQVLAQNGFNEPKIEQKLAPHPEQLLSDISFDVASGPHARIGAVELTGDSGLTVDEFRRYAHLRPGALVDRDTVSRALAGVLKHYRKQNRLEAEIKLESQHYAAHRVNYRFSANRGPLVRVLIEGAPLGADRLKHLIPIWEEGSVDDDLLNEGNRRLRDYYQSLGYFDVKIDHQIESPRPGEDHIVYNVNLGNRRKVQRVSVEGNHYFDSATLEQLLSVHSADTSDRHGTYSQALVASDVAALKSVYQNNGFSDVKVTAETLGGGALPGSDSATAHNTDAPLVLIYHIDEGAQQRVGSVRFEGNAHTDSAALQSLLNTEAGQLLSPRNLAGDRDTLATDYLSRGFEQAHVDVSVHANAADAAHADVVFNITEGPQFFVRDVLISGLHYTRPGTIRPAITLHPGNPLSQSALQETQRNLYDYALFNEINLAVQNPNGAETNKTVLLQASEARRWAFTYGAGFEVQTGTPVNGCQGRTASGVKGCTPEGKTGISPRVLLALTRNNLFGREQSASVQGTYGLLEQRVDLLYQNPNLLGTRKLAFTFTGGYANSRDVTTYVASRLEAGFRFTQNWNHPGGRLSRANTFVYGFDFRRVKVAEDSLEVFPSFVDTLAAAVRVGGPSFTWIRDTRDNPVDARRGTYTSFQEFLSAAPFGAEAHFNRIDVSNSSFYAFNKGRFVLARNTRYGQERAFGHGSGELLPLPERLYAGGPTSLRGFSINAAGPRDPDTGFPIGGAAALVNNVELRLPPPTLPYFENAISFVLFDDMGNVFNNSRDFWPSILRTTQPDRDACKHLTPPDQDPITGKFFLKRPDGPEYSTGPTRGCRFDYFSHAPGLGLRYHTPVGPIRLDFSYNLNPPIYPINVDYSKKDPFSDQHIGEAGHFNFFFSLGQTF